MIGSVRPGSGQAIQVGARAAFWALLAFIVFATFSPVNLRPQTGHVIFERFGAFLALGGTLALSYPRRPFLALAAICAIAVGSEALQLVIPSRDARPIDGLEKTLGGLAGVALGCLLDKAILASRRNSLPPATL
ncbi:MAG TPA: hypothetical protein VGI95_08815 [Caulobacteraceae bacterium]